MHYPNLEQQAHARDNDYTDLEALYRCETGANWSVIRMPRCSRRC
ncbi:MAG TPA: hypothetical protein VFA10_09660 [Ktedonobacteraceae bacterium]|nr:hypothetical protein [Ktedonobacteraceae bacterium]